MFDSFGMRGVQISSDDRMLPDAQRGFAPVVRGVAQSNAPVDVQQNDYVIYQRTVPPAPFEIRGLNPTGYGGDLQVAVTEADGGKHAFVVSYASFPQLLRPDASRMSLQSHERRRVGCTVFVRGVPTQGTLQVHWETGRMGYADSRMWSTSRARYRHLRVCGKTGDRSLTKTERPQATLARSSRRG
ncbi:hypothetical protein WL08_30590 [Burkholderia ubonensis]|nr:hypothetical protein WL08_30590 [Burkholderia ubonensis]